MQHKVLFSFSLMISACALEPKPITFSQAPAKIYQSSFDRLWKAAQFAVKYPIAINNIDSGVLETEWIKAVDGFQPPNFEPVTDSGVRYKILIHAARGTSSGQPTAKVTVTKKIERHKNFFSDPQSLSSDGIEERVILYRIERELAIESHIKQNLEN